MKGKKPFWKPGVKGLRKRLRQGELGGLLATEKQGRQWGGSEGLDCKVFKTLLLHFPLLPCLPLEVAAWLEAKEAAGVVRKSVTCEGIEQMYGCQVFLTVENRVANMERGEAGKSPEQLEMSV